MAVDGDYAVGVFVYDYAVRVHTERADHVLELCCAVNDLAFVKLVGEVGEHLVRQLDAHAQVNAVGTRGDIQIAADAFHPFAAAPAHRDDAVFAFEFAAVGAEHERSAFFRHALHRSFKIEIHLVFELVEQVFEHHKIDIGAQMAHLRVQQMQVRLQAEPLYFGICRGIEPRAFAAVFHVYAVDVAHELKRLCLAGVFVQRAAELVGYVVLAVRKSARAAESVHYGAAFAVDAGLHLVAVDGTDALFERTTLLEHGDGLAGAELDELVSRIYPAGAGAYYYNVVMFHFAQFLSVQSSTRRSIRSTSAFFHSA